MENSFNINNNIINLTDKQKKKLHKILLKIPLNILIKCAEKKLLSKNKITYKENCIDRSHTKLKYYQKSAIKFINDPSQKSLLVVHGTGTGKTLTALASSQCYLDMYPNDKVIVISPASLTDNFSKEMNNRYINGEINDSYHFYSFTKFGMINGKPDKTPLDIFYDNKYKEYSEKYQDLDKDYLISKMKHYFEKEIINNKQKYEKYVQLANEYNINNHFDCQNSMIIIDEAHNLRNMGISYKAVIRCVLQSRKVLLLTATPFVNSLSDFIPLINMLYQNEDILYRDIKGNITKKCIIPKKIKDNTTYNKIMNILEKLLKNKVSFINEKPSEYFPNVRMHTKVVYMDDNFFEKYKKALDGDKIYGDEPEKFYHGYRRAVNKIGIDNYYNQKLKIVEKIIKDGDKTMIFTNWIEDGIVILEKILKNMDINYLIITGKTQGSKRLSIVNNFNTNNDIQVLIITEAGSEGLDLKGIRNVIILDPVWNPASMQQIIGRAVRNGSHLHLQKEDRFVDIYTIILKTPKNIKFSDKKIVSGDEKLYEIIETKNKIYSDINNLLRKVSINIE